MLNGTYYISPVLNETTNFPAMAIQFLTDHEVDCPRLGEGGRFNQIGDYVVISFGDVTHFNGNTSYSIFARVASSNDSFEGILLDHHTGQRYGCAAERTDTFTPNMSFGDFDGLPSWPPNEFHGQEMSSHGLSQPNAFYQFSYESSQVGRVTIGAPQGISRMTGYSTNGIYPSGAEELVVFGTDGLWTYGAVVERTGGEVSFRDGIYMHPFSGNSDNYGSWAARLQ